MPGVEVEEEAFISWIVVQGVLFGPFCFFCLGVECCFFLFGGFCFNGFLVQCKKFFAFDCIVFGVFGRAFVFVSHVSIPILVFVLFVIVFMVIRHQPSLFLLFCFKLFSHLLSLVVNILTPQVPPHRSLPLPINIQIIQRIHTFPPPNRLYTLFISSQIIVKFASEQELSIVAAEIPIRLASIVIR